MDAELLDAAKLTIARQHGIPESRAHRLVGDSADELHRDARALAKELDVLDPTERARDEATGRFAGSSDDEHVSMNQRIRQAAGR